MAKRSEFVFSGDRREHRVRRFFLKLLLSLLLLIAVIAMANMVVSRQVRYTSQSITVPDLADDLENWTILHLSDLHGERFGTAQSGISTAIGTVNVSSVVMTGDMVGKGGDVEPLLELLALLPSDKPKLLLMGDEDPDYLDPTAHGSLSPLADWAQTLVDAGVTILDEPILFTRGTKDQARIWFIPAYLYTLDLDSLASSYQGQLARLEAKGTLTADDAAAKRVAQYQVERVERIRAAIADMKDTDTQIAVSHAPVTQSAMSDALLMDSRSKVFSLRQADLILAGHYCAGQVRLPGLGAVYVPGLGSFPSDALITGYSYVGSVPQYISPGLGTSSVYGWWQSFRFLDPPTVTLVTLTARVR